MKKLYTLSLLLVGALSFGQNLLNEPFVYTVGQNIGGATTTQNDPNPVNNWVTTSNTTGNAGTIDVVAGSLSYIGMPASTGNKVYLPGSNTTVPRDVVRSFTTTATTVYYSALINILDNTQLVDAINQNNNYFMAIGATDGVNVTALGARLGVVSSNSGANFRLGIQNNNGGSNTVYAFNEVDLSFGTTYLVVVKFDATTPNGTVATLWVNPASLGGTEPASTITSAAGTTVFNTLKSIAIRNAGSTPKVEIDEVKVGTTWASVTSAVAGLKDNNIAGLKLFPNPLSGNVLNVTSNSSADKTIAVYDVLGKNVLNAKVTNETVNVSALNSGVYIVKITEEGKTATRKLVVK